MSEGRHHGATSGDVMFWNYGGCFFYLETVEVVGELFSGAFI